MESYKYKIREIIRQVINESFEMDEMAYPANFNFEEFKNLKSFTAKINYARQHLLGRVGAGSSRTVFKVDDEKVIKIAMNKLGVEQNLAESEGYKQEFDVIARVFDIDEQDYTWIEMELAKRISEKRFEEIVGISLRMVVEYLKYQRGLPNKFDTNLFGTMDDSDFINELWGFVQDYDYPVPGDFSRINSYGEVLRDGKPTVVVIDFGFSSNVLSAYKDYRNKKKSRYQLAEVKNDVFNPRNSLYLDAWLNVGDEDKESYKEYGLTQTIPRIIEEVKKLQFPLRIYRGISDFGSKEINVINNPEYDNISWSTNKNIAEKFGNNVFTGVVEKMEDINLEYTIYRRILHKPLDENEIVMKDNNFIKNIEKIK